MTNDGVSLIAAERQRQIEVERYTIEYDAPYVDEELARAATAYLHHYLWPTSYSLEPPVVWPWSVKAWKPSENNRVRDLVKAGALIAAEIDRLRRTP